MDFLKEKLINTAHAKGICAEGYKQMLSAAGVNDMVEYYVANPDWCLERDFPDLQTLRRDFGNVGDKGVFVDRTFYGEVLNDLQTYIFHHCKGTVKVGLNVDKAIIPMIYLANGCRLRIVGVGNPPQPARPSEVPVYVFGENCYSAHRNAYVTFRVYKSELKKE